MTLAAGIRLGPYEIVSPLGAGGMGEVYRAKDTRLKREVAVKVLPAAFSADPDRLRRFEQEALAASALNHPGILTVHDFGMQEGAPYIVTELLDGVTLREKLGGSALSERKTIAYALQIAKGLAAAHAKGIVHRDLKPENLFVTSDSRVKILDFGLAKLTQPEAPGAPLTEAPTLAPQTEAGVIVGTVGYLSPEQVRGLPADPRSDLFAFGAILCEMLTGERTFQRRSAIETMSAILKEEPPELSTPGREVSPGLQSVACHCLEKNPDERFQSARDLAFALEALSGVPAPGSAPAGPSGPAKSRRVLPSLLGAGLFLAGGAVAWLLASRGPDGRTTPSFHQLTFRNGTIYSAAFAPDGQTILYSASWDGGPIQIYSTRAESPESRPLGLPPAVVLGISSSAEMALALRRPEDRWFLGGTLAQAPLGGGSPREILENVQEADWAPDGKQFAVVRSVASRCRLEFPIGKVLYETDGWIGNPRVSPKGDRVAFVEHPQVGNQAGTVAVVDRAGARKNLTGEWGFILGLAWAPAGGEIWFTAVGTGANSELRAVSLAGRQRLLTRAAGPLTIQAVFSDGRALVTRDRGSGGMMFRSPTEKQEHDLYWLDGSISTDISPDGKRLLFFESGGASGKDFSAYLRATDGSPAVRIGDGLPFSLSPDRKWVLSIPFASPAQIVLLPTGAGAPKQVTRDAINHQMARWLPSGDGFVFLGNEPGRGRRLFVQDLSGGKPRTISPEGVAAGVGEFGTAGLAVSPDGKTVASVGADREISIYSVLGGEPLALAGGAKGELPIRWSADGRELYVFEAGQLPTKVTRITVASGNREFWKALMPADPTGVMRILDVQITPDGSSYAYSFFRVLSELYLVEGLK